MVVRHNIPNFGREEPKVYPGADKLLKARRSPAGRYFPTEVSTSPLSPKLSKQISIRRNCSMTSRTLTVAGPAYSTIPAAKFTGVACAASGPSSLSMSGARAAQADAVDEAAAESCALNTDPATQEFQGDLDVSSSRPSKSTLEKVADLPVYDVNGKVIPFKSLYWSRANETRRVMIIFIRHFFCGNCQEYLRALGAAIPPSSLPANTSIRIIGCGSHTLIPSYTEQTKCPYPIFADPSKKLYSNLGMARTLSLGSKDPAYIQHTLVAGMVKSIAQGVKRIGNGDAMQGGDMKQVGGEFLFEVVGGDIGPSSDPQPGNGGLDKVKVSWCHRMRNTRDHAELPQLQNVLDLEPSPAQPRPRSGSGSSKADSTHCRLSEPESSTTTSSPTKTPTPISSWRTSSLNLGRRLSKPKRHSLSWSRSRPRSHSRSRSRSNSNSRRGSGNSTTTTATATTVTNQRKGSNGSTSVGEMKTVAEG